MKFAKIFICTILMVAILSVPCFATNEGTYGHYISPGTYYFDTNFDASNVNISIVSPFISNGVRYERMDIRTGIYYYYVDANGSESTYAYDGYQWVNEEYRAVEFLDGFYLYNSTDFMFFSSILTRINAGYRSSLLDEFLSLFTFVGQWISGAAEDLTSMFWADNSLTFVGTLAVASLAMAVSFLIIGLISRFLRFRG